MQNLEKRLINSKIDVSKLIKKVLIPHVDYQICRAEPAIGIIYVINNFISGHVRLRGHSGGQYPYRYLEMIDNIFGAEKNTIEVCSGPVYRDCVTVDINPEHDADMIDDAQVLKYTEDNTFNRWRCDPPYNKQTARQMYGCEIPSIGKLLKAGSRVVKRGSLLFLLCSHNHQACPATLKRIGVITMSIVPNNEIRVLNIYLKNI